jgi:hypothetical protein
MPICDPPQSPSGSLTDNLQIEPPSVYDARAASREAHMENQPSLEGQDFSARENLLPRFNLAAIARPIFPDKNDKDGKR